MGLRAGVELGLALGLGDALGKDSGILWAVGVDLGFGTSMLAGVGRALDAGSGASELAGEGEGVAFETI